MSSTTPSNITTNTIAWAKQHDWYAGASKSKGKYIIHTLCVVEGRASFTNKAALAAWAGY